MYVSDLPQVFDLCRLIISSLLDDTTAFVSNESIDGLIEKVNREVNKKSICSNCLKGMGIVTQLTN